MERDGTPAQGNSTISDIRAPLAPLPSRASALAACRPALTLGPVLVTGEAGSGKTWFAGQLAADGDFDWRWITVDIAPRGRPVEFLAAVAHAIGLPPTRDARFAIHDYLAESAKDGRRWGLTIDEAHLASPEILDEIRLLANRQGQPDGFDAIVIIAQTAMARRLATPALASLAVRLASHIHLRPLRLDETRLFLSELEGASELAEAEIERLHRDSGGNARRLLWQATAWIRAGAPAESRPAFATRPRDPIEPPVVREPIAPAPLLVSKPPLRMEDGMIEVGWDAESDGRESRDAESGVTASALAGLPAEQAVDDHYAALQAWNEWASNQGRKPTVAASSVELAERGAEIIPPPSLADTVGTESPLEDHPQVWAEGQQTFAPYSQLFSRARQAKDSER